MGNSIQQLNVQFDGAQDRLTLRILGGGDSEIRVWLTRRYTKLLLSVLDSLIDVDLDPALNQYSDDMKDFQREAALEKSNFDEEYHADKVQNFPLGEAPILVTRIDYKKKDNGGVALSLVTEEGQSINLNLDTNLIHALVKILLQGSTMAEWDIGRPKLSKDDESNEVKETLTPDKILH